jgi:hypothetical protein
LSHPYEPAYMEDPFLREETARIQRVLNNPEPFLLMQVLHEAPTRVWAGMVVYADGTDWDPGSGQGLYRRNVANSAWVFVG